MGYNLCKLFHQEKFTRGETLAQWIYYLVILTLFRKDRDHVSSKLNAWGNYKGTVHIPILYKPQTQDTHIVFHIKIIKSQRHNYDGFETNVPNFLCLLSFEWTTKWSCNYLNNCLVFKYCNGPIQNSVLERSRDILK